MTADKVARRIAAARYVMAISPAPRGPSLRAGAGDLGVDMPSREDAVWMLLRHHIGRITRAEIPPREGLGFVHDVHDRAGLHAMTRTYVGDSHGIEGFIGAYWDYHELEERSVGGRFPRPADVVDALDDDVVRLANEWLREHGT